MPRSSLRALLLLTSLCACRSARFPLVPDLHGSHLAVTTPSIEAQQYFDQGLVLYYGFDHEEAERSFERAAELDPQCAMAYWGRALSAGPNINNPTMDEARSRTASENVQRALELVADTTPLERDLIQALGQRYSWSESADRHALDEAYAAAMRTVWSAHRTDADAGALFAEALMDLRPWDLWTADGAPRDGTPEVLETIEAVLDRHPEHVGANHLAIHAWEMSPTPERALPSADRLRNLVPGASHLLHMPAHIDVRLGHYDAAVRANQRAIEAARARVARTGRGGFYAMYRAHNYHFLVYAAQFDGRSALALANARELVSELPPEVVDALPQVVEAFLATPLHVLVRFGRWDEILAEPAPPEGRPSWLAFWHYARGLAHSAQGDVDAATDEQQAFERAAAAVPEDYSTGNNPTRTVLAIGRDMLAGELEYRRGRFDRAFATLGEAVAQDEALRYDEPWGWFQPPAHALGALLLEQGRFAEAEAVYRRDLERHPENGFGLRGLEECLRRSGRTSEADGVLARFKTSWSRADVELPSSCYCRTTSAP